MIKLIKTEERIKELIKTMREPIFFIRSDNISDYLVLKNRGGAVEYLFRGSWSECLNLQIDLKQIKEKNERG